jgi:aspartyl-tRNA synthetase
VGRPAPSVHRAQDGHEDLFASDPAHIAKAYDVVLNGWEIGRGSVRILGRRTGKGLRGAQDQSDQRKRIRLLLDALSYGAPPHGGIAFGLDGSRR